MEKYNTHTCTSQKHNLQTLNTNGRLRFFKGVIRWKISKDIHVYTPHSVNNKKTLNVEISFF